MFERLAVRLPSWLAGCLVGVVALAVLAVHLSSWVVG